jgi:hypothetical protein
MSATRDIDPKTLLNVVPFIPRIFQITENIIFFRWFGSNANIVFGDGILHIHVYVSVATILKFLISPPSSQYTKVWPMLVHATVFHKFWGQERLICFGYRKNKGLKNVDNAACTY